MVEQQRCKQVLQLYMQVHKEVTESQVTALVQAAMALFSRNVKPPFHLTLFNLGATNFVEAGEPSGVSIQKAFKNLIQPLQPAPAAKLEPCIPQGSLPHAQAIRTLQARAKFYSLPKLQWSLTILPSKKLLYLLLDTNIASILHR